MRERASCERCGGMHKRYLAFLYVGVTVCLIAIFPTANSPGSAGADEVTAAVTTPATPLEAETTDLTVASIEEILARRSQVDTRNRSRIARAVVRSARRHNVDPFLVASVLLVESSGDPFAISRRDAVGLMQIHVPTWGALVDAEQISLFRIEDNVDLGTRILGEYTRRYGLWSGVLHYLGVSESSEEGQAYLRRIHDVYTDRIAD